MGFIQSYSQENFTHEKIELIEREETINIVSYILLRKFGDVKYE